MGSLKLGGLGFGAGTLGAFGVGGWGRNSEIQ